MPRRIERVRKGQVITGRQLTEYSDGINKLNDDAANKPQINDDAVDPAVQAEAEEEVESADLFIESSRVISQVQVFDQDETNYALIDRIDSITFANENGKVLKLKFNNPVE